MIMSKIKSIFRFSAVRYSRLMNFSSIVYGLRCQQCFSQKSMTTCSSQQYEAHCDVSEMCFQASWKLFNAWQFHMKGCTPKTQCNSDKLCGSAERDCLYKCCETDSCNGSMTIIYSKWLTCFTFLIVLIVTFWY
uniref:Uncharacterized protein n=1 Tax=Clytia hemisphaerica TaxID=252671 RepID=A0A7M5VDM9_9CNID